MVDTFNDIFHLAMLLKCFFAKYKMAMVFACVSKGKKCIKAKRYLNFFKKLLIIFDYFSRSVYNASSLALWLLISEFVFSICVF